MSSFRWLVPEEASLREILQYISDISLKDKTKTVRNKPGTYVNEYQTDRETLINFFKHNIVAES